MPAKDQLDLSGSLNQLSQQLDATRKLLQDIEVSPPVVPASAALAEKTPPIPLSDDDAVTHG
ncbi:hypothetical protein [Piscinibacter gummiphilus]|uniref:Uncharacterized protein n=1 Tax=Piscinibacter gummiphilus TaxID=946333 RepID=A0ABZ0CSU9_9BURK|nr:hypothetical protein [Piscinibacter gummiphilus]WOB05953.1 hypothetical protein RXV79_13585 [Piscinibacter gummiphilus]